MANARNTKWDSTFKAVAALLSGGAALVSILSFVAGHRESQESARMAGLAAAEVSRIDLSPAADTAYSIGDTLHITTMAADAHGQALHAAAVHWSVDDPAVAEVDSTGQVVARGAGVTSVTVAIGGRAGRARIWVLPRVTALGIEGDSTIRVAEGATLPLHAVARDARGNQVAPTGLAWSAADGAVATVDSAGTLRGRDARYHQHQRELGGTRRRAADRGPAGAHVHHAHRRWRTAGPHWPAVAGTGIGAGGFAERPAGAQRRGAIRCPARRRGGASPTPR